LYKWEEKNWRAQGALMYCRCGDGEAASSFYFVVGWETKNIGHQRGFYSPHFYLFLLKNNFF
jgi:hypothetical protein